MALIRPSATIGKKSGVAIGTEQLIPSSMRCSGTMSHFFSFNCILSMLSSPRQFAQMKGLAIAWEMRDIVLKPQPRNISSWARI